MSSPFILKDGKPVFVGREDPNNPPTAPSGGSKMECPMCHDQVDYLLGDTNKGCEGCYDPSKDHPDAVQGSYDQSKEIM